MSEAAKKLSKDELIEISVRLRKATRGNWMSSPATSVLGSGVVSAPSGRVVAMGVASDDDAEFIAAAHTDVERLLAHINLMEAEQQRWGTRMAEDAYQLGKATGDFIQQQTKHIQALEMGIKDILTAVEIDSERHDIRFTINDQTFAWDTSEPISNPLVKAILALRFLVMDVSQ